MKFVSFSVGKVIGSQSNIIEDRLVKSYYGDLTRSLFSYLTAVLSSFSVSSTDKYMRDVLPEPGLLVHRLALGVVDDGERDLLQDSGQGAVCNDDKMMITITITVCNPLYLRKVCPSQSARLPCRPGQRRPQARRLE